MSTSKPEFNEDINLKTSNDESPATTAANLFLSEIRNDATSRSFTVNDGRLPAQTDPARNSELLQVASIRDYLPGWLGGTPEKKEPTPAGNPPAEAPYHPKGRERSILVKEPTPAGNLPAENPSQPKGKERSILVKEPTPAGNLPAEAPVQPKGKEQSTLDLDPSGSFALEKLDKAKDADATPVEKSPEEREHDRRAAIIKPMSDLRLSLEPLTAENTDAQLTKIQEFVKAHEPRHQTAVDREMALDARMSLAMEAQKHGRPELAQRTLAETMDKYPEAVTDQYVYRVFASTAGAAGMFKDAHFLTQYEKAGGKRESLYSFYTMNADEKKSFDSGMQPLRDVLVAVQWFGTMSFEQRKTFTDFIASCDKPSPGCMDWQAGWSASQKYVQALDATGATRQTIGALAYVAQKYPISLMQKDMLDIAGRNFAGADPRFREVYPGAMTRNADLFGADSRRTWSAIERNGFLSTGPQATQYTDAIKMSQFPSDKSPQRDELRASAIAHNKELIGIHEKVPTDIASRWAAKEMRLQNIEQMAGLKDNPDDLKVSMLEALAKYPELDRSPRFLKQAVNAGFNTDTEFLQRYTQLTGKTSVEPPKTSEPKPTAYMVDPSHDYRNSYQYRFQSGR